MKRLSIGLGMILAASIGLLAAGETAADGVMAAHKAFYQAYKSCNTAAMNALVADDMEFLHVGGMLQNKDEFVKGVGACSLTDMSAEVTNTRVYGDTGIVMG